VKKFFVSCERKWVIGKVIVVIGCFFFVGSGVNVFRVWRVLVMLVGMVYWSGKTICGMEWVWL
jgi:hypothetical protein